MNVKKLTQIRDITTIILQFAIMYIMDLGIITYLGDVNVYVPFIILPALILSYILLKYSKRALVALIVFIVYFSIILLLPVNIVTKVVQCIFYFQVIIMFVKIWCDKECTECIKTPSGAFVIIFLIIQILQVDILSRISFYFGLCFIAAYIIGKYLKNIIRYIYDNNDTDNVPLKQIYKLNGFYLASAGVLAGILSVLGKLLGVDRLLQPILDIIKNIFSTISEGSIDFSKMRLPSAEKKDVAEKHISGLYNNSGIVGKILFISLAIVIAVAALIMGFVILRGIYRRLKSNYYRSSKVNDFIEYIDENSQDYRSNFKSLFNKIDLKGKTNNEKVRLFYYKKILKLKKKDLGRYNKMTPEEISKDASRGKNLGLEEITVVYEKARYSEDECTNQDLNSIKTK